MAYTTQYIGSRYVPLFAEPAEWDSTRTYEPLTIVMHDGNSYTSRQYVPAGIDITNEKFWALTGNYNAQVEQYRKEVKTEKTRAETAEQTLQTNIDTEKSRAEGAEQTLQNGINTNATKITENKNDIATIRPIDSTNVFANMTFPIGSLITTKGFHNADDNGGAQYIISENGTNNGIDSFVTKDSKYANLINTGIVQLEQLGVTSTSDFSTIYNYAISKYNLIGTGSYTLTGTLIPTTNSTSEINRITYNGSSSAILCKNIQNANFKVQRITATNHTGTIALDMQAGALTLNNNDITVNIITGFYIGINLYCDDPTTNYGILYNYVHFIEMNVSYCGIYSKTVAGYCNQNYFYCGKIMSNNYGTSENWAVYIDYSIAADTFNGNVFYNVAFEQCNKGCYLNNTQSNAFIGMRAAESITTFEVFNFNNSYGNYIQGDFSIEISPSLYSTYMHVVTNNTSHSLPNVMVGRFTYNGGFLSCSSINVSNTIHLNQEQNNNQYRQNSKKGDTELTISSPYENILHFIGVQQSMKIIIPSYYFINNNVRIVFGYLSSGWTITVVDDRGNSIDTISGVEGSNIYREYARWGETFGYQTIYSKQP